MSRGRLPGRQSGSTHFIRGGRAWSDRQLQAMFSRLVQKRYLRDTKLVRVRAKEVGDYRFKHAWKFTLTLRTAERRSVRVIVRGNVPSTDTSGEIRIANHVHHSLAKHGFAFGRWRVPLSFGIIPRLHLYLYEHYPGIPLDALLRAKRYRAAIILAKQAGGWIGFLHRKKMRVGRMRAWNRIGAEIGFFRDDFARSLPVHLGDAIRLLKPLEQSQHDIITDYARYFRTTHGDLNLGNIIAGQDGSVGFIDFGGSAIFDPLSDIGNFLAQVDFLAWEKNIPPSVQRRLQRAFLRRYQSSRGLGTDVQRRIDLHRAWWTMQVLAYTISTRLKVGAVVADPARSQVARLLKKYRYVIPPRLNAVGRRQRFAALNDRTVLWAFFNDCLPITFPDYQSVEQILVDHPPAFSRQSLLTRISLTLRHRQGYIQRVAVRGNIFSASTYAILRAITNTKHRRFESIRPLVYLPKLNYGFYEELPGLSMRFIPWRSPAFPTFITAAGRALASFHQLPTTGLRAISWTSEERFLRRLSAQISQPGSEIPEYRLALAALKKAERKHWNDLAVLVHNDFQASNILRTSTGIGIIDYSQSGIAHPGIDVAAFRCHLQIMLDEHRSPQDIEVLKARFLAAYSAASPTVVRLHVRTALAVFELRSYLDILATTVTNLRPGDSARSRYVPLLRQEIQRRLAYRSL